MSACGFPFISSLKLCLKCLGLLSDSAKSVHRLGEASFVLNLEGTRHLHPQCHCVHKDMGTVTPAFLPGSCECAACQAVTDGTSQCAALRSS
jgi:hypothetical protein